jgi:hypothetical protein
MAAILLLFSRIANHARVLALIANTISATATKSSSQEAIDKASKSNGTLFAVYLVVLVATALVLALFTYLTWRSSNRVQDAIVADANARIAEADSKGKEAGRQAGIANKAAGDANERATILENVNLTLRGQVATLETQAADATKNVAVLQKSAADAKAAQQLVQIELARQEEKAAIAEKQLAELKEALRPRSLTEGQHAALVELLSGDPKGPVIVECVLGDGEGKAFATQIAAAMKEAGWTDGGVDEVSYMNGDPEGLEIAVSKADSAPAYIAHIRSAFRLVGIPMEGIADAGIAEGVVRIIVGHKSVPKS